MNTAIRYFTKSKKGNTEKLAKTISKALGVEALTVDEPLTEKVDRLFLVNAMYAANIDKEVKDFLVSNKDKIGEVVNLNTSASGKSTWGNVKKVTDAQGIKLSDKEFHCSASWIFINKGLPSEEDFKRACDFVKSMA
ncbi:MAG: flavodoxin [Sphaerochaetaceae bacterium]|nr:flavodoxin [Sphaerochaetaceae bacterium]